MLAQYEQFFGNKFWNHLVIVLTRIEGKEKRRILEKKKDKEYSMKKKRNQIFKFKAYEKVEKKVR